MSREQNRNLMPGCAVMVDEARQVWGKVKVLYLEENGRTLGDKPALENNCVEFDPDQWKRLINGVDQHYETVVKRSRKDAQRQDRLIP